MSLISQPQVESKRQIPKKYLRQAKRELTAELADLDRELEHAKLVSRCREDVNAFIEYALDVRQHPFHRKLQALAEEYQHLCLDAPIEHGKTFQFSIARPLWLLGRDPHQCIALIGNATENPERCLEVIANQIQNNPRIKQIFPHLNLVERRQQSIRVDRGVTTDKDPSIVAIGVGGSIIGRRWTGVVLDDFCDFDNTWTEAERKKLRQRVESTILGRLIQNGWLLDIGTPWHIEDARHWLRKQPGYHFQRFDALDGLWPEVYQDPRTGKQYGWPKERLALKRRQMSQLEFDRQFRCMAMSASMSIFKHETIEQCKQPGLELGRGSGPEGVVLTGVDLAIKKRESADKTALFTGQVHRGKKSVLDIRTGHWELPDIVREMIATVRRYPDHAGFRVETNAAQDYLRQVVENPEMMKALGADEKDLQRIRVTPHNTTARKYDPVTGIRGMAVDFEQKRWVIPCDEDGVAADEVQDWVDGLVAFDPAGHTNDTVMASWLFCEEARRYWTGSDGTWGRWGIV